MNHNRAPFVLVAVVMNTYMKNRKKTKKKAIDVNITITQMMVGKQWVKR